MIPFFFNFGLWNIYINSKFLAVELMNQPTVVHYLYHARYTRFQLNGTLVSIKTSLSILVNYRVDLFLHNRN
jgi:hypothetical protein